MTPEEQAEHVYDVTIWQYLDNVLRGDPAVKQEMINHIATEIRAAVTEMERAHIDNTRFDPFEPQITVMMRESLTDQEQRELAQRAIWIINQNVKIKGRPYDPG